MKKRVNELDLKIGTEFKKRRMKRGLSQSKLGKLLGVSFQQIQKYEKGINRISTSRLIEASKILDFDLKDFFDSMEKKRTAKETKKDKEIYRATRAMRKLDTIFFNAVTNLIHDLSNIKE